ncbi:hypothetical protein CCC_00541 [Paramagnetospirillum magnetotacticum MS-1]|nr:hypothetical protein CCC_00541 [Paramagnetospirillum magnetotacticum MS-1]
MPPDAQRDEKMEMSMVELLERFKAKGVTVLMMESNAT